MTKKLQIILHMVSDRPWGAILLCAACIDSLIAAYILENYFDVYPCDLCIKERFAFALGILFTIPAFTLKLNDKVYKTLMILCAVGFFVNVGLAFFHSGVELQWWSGTDGCDVNPLVFATDPAAMREALLSEPTVPCDEINFTFLGLTLANWNIPWSLALAFYSLMIAFYPQWKDRFFKS